MPQDRLIRVLASQVEELERKETAKGNELVVRQVLPSSGERGPRFLLDGFGDREFLRLNSNSYLGLSFHPAVVRAEEEGAARFGAGPGAVRFISGSYETHVALEERLAAFHGREAGMVFSSAYATVLGTLAPLIDRGTAVVSDELNHNCIINAVKMARPAEKVVFPHLDMEVLDRSLSELRGKVNRVVVVTDGIFSMRGDHAPLDRIMAIAREHDAHFPENVIVVVDDSHGVGAFGRTGRGTEEHTDSPQVDVLIGTLGKAFGVNGGYVVGATDLIRYLREAAPTYIYSNPITPGEASACLQAVEVVDSEEGRRLLGRLRELTGHFEEGLGKIGIETIPGEHPVVPLMIRDTARTRRLVQHLFQNDVLVTGLAYPVVPRGDEEIRTQVNADHTFRDLDRVLEVLAAFSGAPGSSA
ncbi:MAG: aminotransferase class I/II-fold pyridoxal phosphate-dependent enzyme [Gemmatimonadota bacterium]